MFGGRNFAAPSFFPSSTSATLAPCLKMMEGCRNHQLRKAPRPCHLQAFNLPVELLGPTQLLLSYQMLVTATVSQERKQRCLISLPCIQLESELFSLSKGHRLMSPHTVWNKRDQVTVLSRSLRRSRAGRGTGTKRSKQVPTLDTLEPWAR